MDRPSCSQTATPGGPRCDGLPVLQHTRRAVRPKRSGGEAGDSWEQRRLSTGTCLHRPEGCTGSASEWSRRPENVCGGGRLGPAETAGRGRTEHPHVMGAFPLRTARKRATGRPRGKSQRPPQDSIPIDVGTIRKAVAREATGTWQRGWPDGQFKSVMQDRLSRPAGVKDWAIAVDIHQLRAGHWSGSEQYLHRIGRRPTPDCRQCSDVRCSAALCRCADGRRTPRGTSCYGFPRWLAADSGDWEPSTLGLTSPRETAWWWPWPPVFVLN